MKQLLIVSLLATAFLSVCMPGLHAQTNTFPATGNAGIGTTAPSNKLTLDLGSTRDAINLLSDGSTQAFSDLFFSIKNPATLSVPTGNPYIWAISHRKDGHFSGGAAMSTLEFYAQLVGGGYYTPLIFKANADVILASPFNTAKSGRVGIGIVSPTEKLEVAGNIVSNGALRSVINSEAGPFLELINSSKTATGTARRWTILNMTGSYGNSLQFWAYDQAGCSGGMCANRFTITDAGNVGIGTNTPNAKLTVAGGISAQKIKVSATNAWPDYVFEPSYALPSLKEVERYIQQHKHLPDVPSAKDVDQNGLDLGDNQAVLLKKIEELTLYMIAQDKRMEEQDKKMEAMQAELDRFKSRNQ